MQSKSLRLAVPLALVAATPLLITSAPAAGSPTAPVRVSAPTALGDRVELKVTGSLLADDGESGASQHGWVVVRNTSGRTVTNIVAGMQFLDGRGEALIDDGYSLTRTFNDETVFELVLRQPLRPGETVALHDYIPNEARQWRAVGAVAEVAKASTAKRNFRVVGKPRLRAVSPAVTGGETGWRELVVTVRNKSRRSQSAPYGYLVCVTPDGKYQFGEFADSAAVGEKVRPRGRTTSTASFQPDAVQCKRVRSVVLMG